MKNLKIGDKELLSERTQESLAVQMYLDLGFHIKENDKFIEFTKFYKESKTTGTHRFYYEQRNVVFLSGSKFIAPAMNIDEITAFNQKLKELGWI